MTVCRAGQGTADGHSRRAACMPSCQRSALPPTLLQLPAAPGRPRSISQHATLNAVLKGVITKHERGCRIQSVVVAYRRRNGGRQHTLACKLHVCLPQHVVHLGSTGALRRVLLNAPATREHGRGNAAAARQECHLRQARMLDRHAPGWPTAAAPREPATLARGPSPLQRPP